MRVIFVKVLIKSNNYDAKSKEENPSLVAVKRIECLNHKFFIVIDQSIVDNLHLSENDNTWVRQILSDDGIFMKLQQNPWTEAN
jgi:hypothetical protein